MFKKIAICLVVAFFMLGGALFVTAKETISGLGVAPARTPIDTIAMLFTTAHPNIAVKTKEEKADATVKTIGAGVGGYNFGMLIRPLTAKERAAYPDVRAFVFGRDGVAITVHPDNPVKGLTSAQVRDIYSGKITNWAQVGGRKEAISVLIREAGSGSRVAFEETTMGGARVTDAAHVLGSTGAMRKAVAADSSTIGYMVFGAVDDTVRAIGLDGAAPTIGNVEKGVYKISSPFYLITKGEPRGAAKTFIDYVTGPEGQSIMRKLGFSPVK